MNRYGRKYFIIKPKMMTSKLLLLALLVNLLLLTDGQLIGVCNGRLGDPVTLPSEEAAVTLFKENGISRMRIYEPYQTTLKALSGTNIELILDVPNGDLERLATSQNEADTWVQENVINYYNEGVKFRYIAVGNEVDPAKESSSQYVNSVLPAMNNVYNAIRNAQLSDHIKVSTATYTGLLSNSYPPSAGKYKDTQGFIEKIVEFLVENSLPMLVNIYPYFAYTGDPNVQLQYALLEPGITMTDQNNGLVYSNLFDSMLDAHYTALAQVGGNNVKIVVSESGWPSGGGHKAATVENAGTYYKNLIEHVKGSAGTPAKPNILIETYLFAMFDENQKEGDETERHFGIFTLEGQPKYDGLSFN